MKSLGSGPVPLAEVLSYRLSRLLLGVSVLLTLLSAGLNGLVELRGTGDDGFLVDVERLFDVVEESTVQSWFSTVILAAAACLAAAAAIRLRRSGDRWWRRWVVITLALAWVSLDEAVSIHELLNDPEAPPGLLRYRWVFFVLPPVVALAVWILPALHSLGPILRRLLIASGVIYVGGAAGVEWLTGLFYGTDLVWGSLAHVEEFLEMAGVVIFIEALLRLNGVPRDEWGRIQVPALSH